MFNNKQELNAFIQKLKEGVRPKLDKDQLLELRDDVFRLSFVSDLPSRDFIYLSFVFENSCLEPKGELEIYIKTADENIDLSSDATQKLLLLELKTICLILNSHTQEALDFYLFNYCLIYDPNLNDAASQAKFFKIFFADIKFETYLNIVNRLLEPNYFLNLPQNTQRIILFNIFTKFWTFKNICMSEKFSLVYEIELKLFRELLNADNLDMAMNLTLSMLHFYLNIVGDFERVNIDIIKPLETKYKLYAKTTNLAHCFDKKHSKKRIGFLRDKMTNNSPFKVEYSMIKALLEDKNFSDKYEIYFYSLHTPEKYPDMLEVIAAFTALDVNFKCPSFAQFNKDGFLYSYLQKALIIRDEIINDEIDILIDLCGSNPFAEFLFSTRSAKTQIFFSHGNIWYDIEDIDIRMSHFAHSDRFEFKQINVVISNEFYMPSVDKDVVFAERAKYPAEVILGTIGRYVKIDDEAYLRTVSEILKQNPNSLYLACGADGDMNSIKAKLSKFGVLDRFIFAGVVDSGIYGYVIDIMLGTFPPLEQGESANEFKAKGGAMVGLYKPDIVQIEDEKLREIKFDSSKVLVYIENLDEFDENVTGFSEFMKDPKYIILCANSNKRFKEKSIIGDIKFYDIKVAIENGKIVGKKFNQFIYKPLFKEHAWFIKNFEICDWYIKNKKICCINENDYIWGYFTPYNEEDYISRVNELIRDTKMREKLGKFNMELYKAIEKIGKKSVIKDFLNIICQK